MISMKGNSSRTANPSSIKTRFAVRFLQSVSSLNKKERTRYRSIRAASYASMASVIGRRRAWSRAILRKVRNRTLDQFLMRRRSRFRPKEDELRRLVPGGSRMGPTALVRDTAHYIGCLRTQVQVMTAILDRIRRNNNNN